MVNKKYTTIRLQKETAGMLKDIGKKSETYDELIRRLMKNGQ